MDGVTSTGWQRSLQEWYVMAPMAIGGQRARHEFARALQGALTLDEVERAYMSSIGLLVDADAVGLYRLGEGEDDEIVVSRQSNLNERFLEEYEVRGRRDDPVLEFVRTHGRPIDSSRAAEAERWADSGAHRVLLTSGLTHSMEAPILVSGCLLGTINFARGADLPAFSRTDLTSARLACEQLALATERALRFELTGHRTSAIEKALDRLGHGVVITDLDGQTLFENHVARRDDAGRLAGARRDRDAAAIRVCIEQALTDFRVRGKRVSTHSVKVPGTNAQQIVKSYRITGALEAAVTFVFDCGEPQGPHALPAWDVLSRREQEIAQLVSEGLTTKQIAERAFISENTVKQHLKRVFAKTDVRNRAELVQLIWSSGASRSAAG